MLLEIDHVITCVSDLDEAVELFANAYGLRSVPGGRHSGHGTANHIVPLGSAYVEMVSVVDADEASSSHFAAWVEARASTPGIHAVCLRTDDIDEVARHFGLVSSPMSRVRPDGVTLSWRLAGLEAMLEEGLPFFIQWDVDEDLLPGRSVVHPPNPTNGFDEVVLSGQRERLESWVGACEGLRFVEGEPGVVSAVVQSVELA